MLVRISEIEGIFSRTDLRLKARARVFVRGPICESVCVGEREGQTIKTNKQTSRERGHLL